MTEQTNDTELTQEQKDQQAAERFRAQQTGPAKEVLPVERPADIPEKFWNAEKGAVDTEALLKSYIELEKLRGKTDDKPVDDKPKDDKPADNTDDDPKVAFAKLREETSKALLEHGAPTDEQYAAYEKLGFSREDIDEFAEFQKSRGASEAAKVHAEVGGSETYQAMIEWAKTALTADEIAAYDRAVVDGKDAAMRLNAVRGLKARFEAAVGREGRSVTQQGATTGGASGYSSKAEMIRDMADPRYAKDEAFRREVARKVTAARSSGVELT